MRLRAATIAFSAFLASTLAAGDVVRGRLCVTGSECRDASCGAAIEPVATPRTYAFSVKGESTILGIIESDHSTISCQAGGFITLRVPPHLLPRKTDVSWAIANDAHLAWSFLRSERESASGTTLRIASGTYTLTAEVPHFARFRRMITVGAQNQIVVADLKPLPVLSGDVVDASTHRGIGGVLLQSDADTQTTTDAAGRFLLEADPEQWPAVIRTTAEGYAGTSVFVPRARVNVTVDPIVLQRGGAIRAVVEGEAADAVVGIELLHIVNKVTLSAVRSGPFGEMPARRRCGSRMSNRAPTSFLRKAIANGSASACPSPSMLVRSRR